MADLIVVDHPLAVSVTRRAERRPGVCHDVGPEDLLFQVGPGRATVFSFPSPDWVNKYGVK